MTSGAIRIRDSSAHEMICYRKSGTWFLCLEAGLAIEKQIITQMNPIGFVETPIRDFQSIYLKHDQNLKLLKWN